MPKFTIHYMFRQEPQKISFSTLLFTVEELWKMENITGGYAYAIEKDGKTILERDPNDNWIDVAGRKVDLDELRNAVRA